jgi:hypothetical protein
VTDFFSPQIKIFVTPLKNSYLYDYQFIRKDDNITERRTLLEENGKKRNEPEAKLKTRAFRFRDVLFGPIGLLGEKAQNQYAYQLERGERLDGKKTVVIRANPLASAESRILAGKVWVGEDDFAILKIEWLPETIGHFETISRRAKRLGATPLVTAISEYGFEKNGIRFPSRSHTEEAYLTKKGKKFVRSETTVLYIAYKFFTVQTQVEYAARPYPTSPVLRLTHLDGNGRHSLAARPGRLVFGKKREKVPAGLKLGQLDFKKEAG